MKADRLLSILLLLRTREQVSAPELAERLEVSVRTVYRDVEALSAAGVPVWAERGRTGGIRLLPGYRTDVSGLTGDEARALFVLAAGGAGGTHEALGLGSAFGSALRKLMAALPAPHRPAAELVSERVLVDPERWLVGGPAAGAGARGPSGLGVLQRAVFADRRLRLTYRHSGADADARYTVDPYGLVSKAGTWYLVADLHGEPRLFRADRVGAAEVAEEEPVRRRPGVTLGQAWALLRDRVEHRPLPFPVRCRVRRGSWGLFRRLHGTYLRSGGPPGGDHDGAEGGGEGGGDVGAVGGSGEDGWYQVELAFPAAAAVRTLLPLAADVEVLDPPSARAELAAAAAEVVALYARS